MEYINIFYLTIFTLWYIDVFLRCVHAEEQNFDSGINSRSKIPGYPKAKIPDPLFFVAPPGSITHRKIITTLHTSGWLIKKNFATLYTSGLLSRLLLWHDLPLGFIRVWKSEHLRASPMWSRILTHEIRVLILRIVLRGQDVATLGTLGEKKSKLFQHCLIFLL